MSYCVCRVLLNKLLPSYWDSARLPELTKKDEVTHLNEGKQEAHRDVGQPVHGARNHEGSRAVRLFKQFSGQDEGDPTWQR